MPVDTDGSLVQYTDEEIAEWDIRTRGVRDGSHPRETFGPDGATCERSWFVRWEHRHAFKDWLVGKVVVYTDSGSGDQLLSRLMPQTHPDFPSWICTKVVDITGHQILADDADGMPTYTDAEVRALYEMAPFLLLEDTDPTNELARYTTYAGGPGNEIQVATDYLSMPGGTLNFLVEGGELTPPFTAPHMTPIPYGWGFPVVKETWSMTWKRVPYTAFTPGSALWTRVYGDPSTGTRPYLGAYNKTEFQDRKPGTTQLIGVEPRLLPDPDGEGWAWDLKYTFNSAPEGQLAFYFFDTRRDATGAPVTPSLSGWYQVGRGPQWYAPEDVPDGTSLFVPRDLNMLWDLNP